MNGSSSNLGLGAILWIADKLHYLKSTQIPNHSAIRKLSTIWIPTFSRIWIPTVIVLEKIDTVETFQIADKYLSIIQIVETYMSIIKIVDKYMSIIQIVFEYQKRVW